MTEQEFLKKYIDAYQQLFNDFKKNQENLSNKFELTVHGGGTLKMRITSCICGDKSLIEFDTKTSHGHTATASITEAYKIRGALSRLIARAERS